MGYRSDVGLALTQSAVQTLNQKMNALDKNSEAFSVITDFFAYADKHFEDTESWSEVYLWESVKWYEEFPNVDFIEHLLAELDWSDFLFIQCLYGCLRKSQSNIRPVTHRSSPVCWSCR